MNPCRRTHAMNHATTPQATKNETTNPMASVTHCCVEIVAGGYDLGPLGPGSERAVLVAVRE